VHAAAFQEQYEAVTAFATAARGDSSGYDPAELVRQAILELEDDAELLRQERERARWLFVDEYQDTDPAQVRLLRALAGDGRGTRGSRGPGQGACAHRLLCPAAEPTARVRRVVQSHARTPSNEGPR